MIWADTNDTVIVFNLMTRLPRQTDSKSEILESEISTIIAERSQAKNVKFGPLRINYFRDSIFP